MGGRPERKFFDTVRAANIPGTGGTIFNESLNLIPQGATTSERVGHKCTIVSIHMRISQFVTSSAVPGDTGDAHRIIVYLDRQCNGAAATPSNILAAAVNINAFNNIENSSRFRILLDKVSSIHTTAGGIGPGVDGTSPRYLLRTWNKKCRIPLYFSGATGQITELRSNNIGVLIVSADANANCVVAYTARVRYTDV